MGMMKKKKNQLKPARNWALVVVAVSYIVINLILLVIGVMFWSDLGWWAPAIVIGAMASIYFSIEAIRTNEPAWLLLDIILPG